MLDRLTSLLPNIPNLGREAEIPVYLVHMGADAEDYFFLFDFESFAEASGSGAFVRPRLKVFAGRNDFSRTIFSRHFRETFQQEFDRMRADLGRKKNRGWLSWEIGETLGGLVTGLISNLVLAIALSAGRAALGRVGMAGLLRGKSKEAALNDEIDGLKSRVDGALAEISIALHPELHAHARGLGGPANRSGMEDDAWPLPEYVRTHLDDGSSGSWW